MTCDKSLQIFLKEKGKLSLKEKGDYPPAHRLNVNLLLSNITFFVIFAVLDVSFAVN